MCDGEIALFVTFVPVSDRIPGMEVLLSYATAALAATGAPYSSVLCTHNHMSADVQCRKPRFLSPHAPRQSSRTDCPCSHVRAMLSGWSARASVVTFAAYCSSEERIRPPANDFEGRICAHAQYSWYSEHDQRLIMVNATQPGLMKTVLTLQRFPVLQKRQMRWRLLQSSLSPAFRTAMGAACAYLLVVD